MKPLKPEQAPDISGGEITWKEPVIISDPIFPQPITYPPAPITPVNDDLTNPIHQ